MKTQLHIGCGKRDFGSDWTHIDGGDFPHVIHRDVTLRHFHGDQADVIYSAHLLEYFDRADGLEVLKEWYRVLKPGGVLRIAVPDWDNIILAVRHYDFTLDDVIGPLFGKMEMAGQMIYHKTVYDFKSLKKQLTDAGFTRIRRYDWRQTDHAHFDDHSQAYLPKMDKENGLLISLNVEATK